MNCEQLRDRLPLLIYGDLNPDEERLASDHLVACAACRHERDALLATRQVLDASPFPEMRVDVASIHSQALVMQARSIRRWKRFAFTAGVLAASLLAILLIRLEIRAGNGEFAIRWGTRSEPSRTVEHVTVVQAVPSVRDTDLEERIRVLSELVKVLHLQMERADQKRREELEVLITRVDLLRIQSQQRWDETNRDVSALYTAQFGRKE